MGLLRRGHGDVVAGRAFVVPTAAANVGGDEFSNFDNLSHRSRAKTRLLLVLRSASDGGPVPAETQEIKQQVGNWVRFVLHSAGTNETWAQALPAELEVPVLIDRASRRIVALDHGGAERELEPYRAAARTEWKQTEAPLADARNIVSLPGDVAREGKDLVRTWRSAARDLRADLKAPAGTPPREPSAEETEQLRRTAVALRYQLERNPKQYAKVRASALQAGPMIAESTRGGTYGHGNFNHWLVLQHTSGVITDAEAEAFRSAAGVPAPPANPTSEGSS